MKQKNQKPPKLSDWIVTRIVEEKMEVQSVASKQEALDRAQDPFSVRVVKETARKIKGSKVKTDR